MKKLGYIMCGLSLLILSSCFSYKQVTIDKIEDLHIKNVGKKGIQAEITAKITNPNKYAIRVKSSDLQLRLNSSDIGTANIVKPVKIKKNSTAEYTVAVDVTYKELAGGVLGAIPGILLKKSTKLDLKGTIKGRAGLISKKVDVSMSDNINLTK